MRAKNRVRNHVYNRPPTAPPTRTAWSMVAAPRIVYAQMRVEVA